MSHERWRTIPGFENYKVSNLGRVKNVKTKKFLTPHLMAGNSRPKYLRVWLFPGRRVFRVHKLVLLAFRGPAPIGKQGRHLNDNKLDNRLVNLRYGTRKQNMADAIRNDRIYHTTGELDGMAKLTEVQVLEARRRRLNGEGNNALAREYGVTKSAMSRTLRGLLWAHI